MLPVWRHPSFWKTRQPNLSPNSHVNTAFVAITSTVASQLGAALMIGLTNMVTWCKGCHKLPHFIVHCVFVVFNSFWVQHEHSGVQENHHFCTLRFVWCATFLSMFCIHVACLWSCLFETLRPSVAFSLFLVANSIFFHRDLAPNLLIDRLIIFFLIIGINVFTLISYLHEFLNTCYWSSWWLIMAHPYHIILVAA